LPKTAITTKVAERSIAMCVGIVTMTVVRQDGTKARRRVGVIAMCRPDRRKSMAAMTAIVILTITHAG
jgi:hypothetical protein